MRIQSFEQLRMKQRADVDDTADIETSILAGREHDPVAGEANELKVTLLGYPGQRCNGSHAFPPKVTTKVTTGGFGNACK
jgi:hypothetical protein